MIKIIHYGTRKKIECEDCGTIFSYDYGDVSEEKFKIGWKRYVICPVCNKKVVTESCKSKTMNITKIIDTGEKNI